MCQNLTDSGMATVVAGERIRRQQRLRMAVKVDNDSTKSAAYRYLSVFFSVGTYLSVS